MFVIIGVIVVAAAVIGGFVLAGGDVILLIQPAEYVVIIGAAIGSLLISAPVGVIKKIIKTIPSIFKSHAYSKEDYLELLKAFNDLFLLAQREGLLAIEKHVESPEESDILSKNQKFIKNELAKTFFCDTMKVMLSGGVPPHELENLIDAEIETLEAETKPAINAITKMSDAFPGLGIVAAVLGIIVTMGSIDAGAVAVGHHVAAALVGTFLGVLLAYGFVGPLATNMEVALEEKMRYLETIKTCVVAYAKGNPPIIAVEIARRTIFTDERPTFSELEKYMRGKTD